MGSVILGIKIGDTIGLYQECSVYGGCPILLFIETAILREKNINIRETFANPVFFFRGGSPCHETI